MIKNELTLEITDYCPHCCKYCSSNSSNRVYHFMSTIFIIKLLGNKYWKRINISGGESLAHPKFYQILNLCKKHADFVWVYTNALQGIMFNVNVISDVRVEANLTVHDDTDKIHILRRVRQGREKRIIEHGILIPKIQYSGNYSADIKCKSCDHEVVLVDGRIVPAPCKKEYNNIRPDKERRKKKGGK